MVQAIPPPDPQSLLPPLLACLPVSFASSRPPPAFLPLLSPILRQRLHVHTTTSSSAHDSWIRLVCWDSSKAETLKETIENANFEPHPSSGELEVGELDPITYKRFDAETLKVQIPMTDWSFTALYLWCTDKEEGDGWKLAELLPYDSDLSRDPTWSSSISEAEIKAQPSTSRLSAPQNRPVGGRLSVPGQEEDDDYWAQYDNTPGATPARKHSINPGGSASEADYYSRYAEVQPAMDNFDPDEQHEEIGQTTLNGDALSHIQSNGGDTQPAQQQLRPDFRHFSIPEDDGESLQVSQPVPASPSSRSPSEAIAKLESSAEMYSASEIAIKQHISTTMKSMFRLARGAGISRQEFDELVARELETMSIFDRDD